MSKKSSQSSSTWWLILALLLAVGGYVALALTEHGNGPANPSRDVVSQPVIIPIQDSDATIELIPVASAGQDWTVERTTDPLLPALSTNVGSCSGVIAFGSAFVNGDKAADTENLRRQAPQLYQVGDDKSFNLPSTGGRVVKVQAFTVLSPTYSQEQLCMLPDRKKLYDKFADLIGSATIEYGISGSSSLPKGEAKPMPGFFDSPFKK